MTPLGTLRVAIADEFTRPASIVAQGQQVSLLLEEPYCAGLALRLKLCSTSQGSLLLGHANASRAVLGAGASDWN